MHQFSAQATSIAARRPKGIALVDQHPAVLSGFRLLLADRDDLALLFAAQNLAELEAHLSLSMSRPHVVVVDPTSRALGGLHAVERVRHVLPDASIVLFCSNPSKVFVTRALELGVNACLDKSAPFAVLLAELLRVSGPRRPVGTVETLAQSRPLSAVQVRIVFLLARGLSVREIADRLAVSERTVSSHKVSAQRHFGANTTAELILAWDAVVSAGSPGYTERARSDIRGE